MAIIKYKIYINIKYINMKINFGNQIFSQKNTHLNINFFLLKNTLNMYTYWRKCTKHSLQSS